MQKPTKHIGVDIAKKEFVAASPDEGIGAFPQTKQGYTRFLAKLPPTAQVACEATGGYESPFLDACHEAGVPVFLLNPKRVRDFARSQGVLAKNDAVDAKIIARFLSKSDGLREHRSPSQAEKHLRELTALHRHYIEERNRLISYDEHPADCALVKKKLKARRRALDKDIEEVEKEIERVAKSEPALKARIERCCEVQGIAVATAAGLLGHMPELGTCDPGCCAALAGLAPICRQSGTYDGKRHIGGGRPEIRRILYMSALSALRCNPVLKVVYQRHRTNGKPFKVAVTAIMRKLIELLNHMLKNPKFSIAT